MLQSILGTNTSDREINPWYKLTHHVLTRAWVCILAPPRLGGPLFKNMFQILQSKKKTLNISHLGDGSISLPDNLPKRWEIPAVEILGGWQVVSGEGIGFKESFIFGKDIFIWENDQLKIKPQNAE